MNQAIKACFKKVRICDKPNKIVDELFKKRKELRNKTDNVSKVELKQVEEELAKYCAENNFNTIKDEIDGIKPDEGGIHSGKLWKLKKKLSPRCRDPPTAMQDKHGNLVSSPRLIEKLSLETFKERLKNRNIKDNLVEMKNDKEAICKAVLKNAAKKYNCSLRP